ncbi:unnamed protein product [Phytophthora lilii]|uniref:Unnamed protein product n=1 Tax=Phytophthora lilii TaxID=2077276 RepID=A0A9W6XGX1_9STRA|nr:unnamed protein product [Phytophthora lilii]
MIAIAQIAVIVIDAFPTFFTIWDVYRSQWFWLGVPLVENFPNAVGTIVATFAVLEIIEEGNEATVYGLITTVSTLASPFASVITKSIDGYFDVETEFIRLDNSYVRWQVTYTYLIAYAFKLCSLGFLVLLPKQKVETQQLKRTGGKNKWIGIATIIIIAFSLVWSVMTNLMTMFDSTSCLPRWKEPLLLTPSQLKKFKTLCKQFCHHKIAPRAVLDYAFSAFGDEKTIILVNKLTLQRIQDPERRASLLLSLMYLRPNTKTNCCGDDFCFNCKGEGHHETCAEEFSEDNDLVRCRGCRALLLKVEGCNGVNCVCGFYMDWGDELELRKKQKRGLLPVDISDIPLTNDWFYFQYCQTRVVKRIPMQRWVVISLLPRLRPVLAGHVWRSRLRQILATDLISYYQARRTQWVDRQLVAVKAVLRAPLADHIWRRRFNKAVVAMESELFWKAYYCWHPEEAEDDVEEVNCFLNIDAFDGA